MSAEKKFDMQELKQKKLLSTNEAAFYLDISLMTFYDIMKSDNFYPLVRIGHNRGRVFINREKLDKWIDEQDGSMKTIR